MQPRVNVRSWALFFAFAAVAVLLSYWPLRWLVEFGRSDHIPLVPVISAYFLFLDKKNISEQARSTWKGGVCVGSLGLFIYLVALWLKPFLSENDFASLTTGGSVVFLWGGFFLAFGPKAWKTARFPLLFLLFAIPVPLFLLDGFISILQRGSTEMTQWLFDLTRTDYFRDGFVYQLTGITIEVAKECSGIRSTIALIITGVLAGHLFLKSGWKTTALLIAMLPITIIKNGIRILTLSLLAIYVDTKFITDSFLHHSGGFLFYIPALGFMALAIWGLSKLSIEPQNKEAIEDEDRKVRATD